MAVERDIAREPGLFYRTNAIAEACCCCEADMGDSIRKIRMTP